MQALQARDEEYNLMTPGSQMIVLTDAPSKNTSIKDWVIDRAKSLGVCIHFYLARETDNCFSADSVESYRNIAWETGGSVVENTWNFSNFVASYRDIPCADVDSPHVLLGRMKGC